MSNIIPLILDRMLTIVNDSMLPLYEPDSIFRKTGKIKVGRFQDDPSKTQVYITLNPGDIDHPTTYYDGIVTLGDMQNIGISSAFPREIGGGERWWRRFTARIGCYWTLTKYDEHTAMEESCRIYGDLCNALRYADLGYVSDGQEVAIQPFIFSSTFYEGGGDGAFLWRGKVMWSVLTEKQ